MSKNPICDFGINWDEIKDRKFHITSDTHAYHKNITRGVSEWDRNCRDFNTLEEMTDAVIAQMNIPDKEDVILHLGDWSFGGKDKITLFREQIQCNRIILLYGNHDTHIRKDKGLQNLFYWTGDYLEMSYKGKYLVMSHYPIGSWNHMKNSIHFHGHSHGNYEPKGRMLDVGLDYNGMEIWELSKAIEFANSRDFIRVDHHS